MQKIRPDKRFGNNIRVLRQRCEFTQEQTAAKLQVEGYNISRGVYAQIECGLASISVGALVALKRIFRAEYSDFFDGIE